jgi:ligand-binding sensor domain-containing protein
MKHTIQVLLIAYFQVLISVSCLSQSSYLVTNYGMAEYGAGSQNWSIDNDKRGFIYIANNNGLLVFDGAHWKTYHIPGQSIVRSVHVSPDNRIYVGSFEEFGFWQENPEGELVYHSLKPLLKNYDIHNKEIWKIVQVNDKIYFQSFSSLFVYDQKTVKSIDTPGNVVFLLKAGNRLFIQAVSGALYELVNEKLAAVNGSGVLSGTEVKTILPFHDHNYLIGTTSDGVFLYDGETIVPWKVPVNEQLKKYQINNGVISGNRIIFGTIVKGVFILNQDGSILCHYHSGNELQNNTVLALCSDQNQSIWVGLDMGISNISFNHPIEIYQENNEQLGAVYTAALAGSALYVGTNRGVFKYIYESGNYKYEGIVDKSQGQVWQIRKIDGSILCGHTSGTYQIQPSGFSKISDVSGGYSLQKIIHNGQEFLIQSTYTSLVVYKKSGTGWTFSHVIKGFIEPSRFMETDHLGNIWIGHAVKGLYKLKLNERLDSVTDIRVYGQKDGLPSDFNIKVFKVEERVVFLTGSKIYTWDDLRRKIIPLDELNNQLQGFETANSIADIGDNLYWLIGKNDIALFDIHENRVFMKYRLLLPLYSISLVDQYANIVAINDTLNLICLNNGFAIFNTNRLTNGFRDNSKLIWSGISCFNAEGAQKTIKPGVAEITVKHEFNNLVFSYSVIQNPGVKKLFQCKLEGIDPDWSEWSDKSGITYTRLPKGEYKFQVRTLTVSGKLSDPLTIVVNVLPAWYASSIAYLIYILVSLALIWIILLFSRKRIEKKHERVRNEDIARRHIEKQQAEQEIITLQNQNLQAEISHKNIQLADSTMAIIKKNEVLIAIKNELARQKEELGSRYPTRYFDKFNFLIDKNISNDKDWQVFESLFDQAHENFFKRLKQTYPDLTQSDLKLCAYLKLNLSSKEIAPLLNISLRGVEIRRYRLRKRLSLSTDLNLVDFIMQL